MTVKELIGWLEKQPEDTDIYVENSYGLSVLTVDWLRVACLDPDDEEAVIIG